MVANRARHKVMSREMASNTGARGHLVAIVLWRRAEHRKQRNCITKDTHVSIIDKLHTELHT